MRALGTHRLSYGRFSAGLALAFAAFVLAGCAAKPPVTTPVALTLVASADVNPDSRNRASPVTVRVYAMKSPGPFEGADFFSLFEKDQATLGAEMVQREELLLRPGDSKSINMTLAADVKAIGVMAAYRDLDRARWREVKTVVPGQPLNLTVNVGARQIRIDPQK